MNFPRLSRPLAVSCCLLQSLAVLPAAESDRAPVVIEDIALTLLWVPPGKLPGVTVEDPARTVKEGFWLAKTELTQLQWKSIMSGRNPSSPMADDHPVQQVSYLGVFTFFDRLNWREKEAGRLPEGYTYTLPNELQWIYAARAGDVTDGSATLEAQAWTDANSQSKTQPVATKAPNAWGFYDMRGNVWEWCQETPGISAKGRFVRGGGSAQPPAKCGYNNRLEVSLDVKDPQYGLRLALSKNPLVPPAVVPEIASILQPPVPTPVPRPATPQVAVPQAAVSGAPKTTQSIGGIRIESAKLAVIFEDRGKLISRPKPSLVPTPTPDSGQTPGGVVSATFSFSNVPKGMIDNSMTPERRAFKEEIAKDLEKSMPGRHILTRAGQAGKATHEDSFNEMMYHALQPGTDAILWVTDLNSPFTSEEVEELTRFLEARKVTLYILSTLNSATENTDYRRDNKPGFQLMDYVRKSGGSFRREKLKP